MIDIELEPTNQAITRNDNSQKKKWRKPNMFTIIFGITTIVSCVVVGWIISNFVHKVEWNNGAKEIYANVTLHTIYKNRIEYSSEIYGIIHVDFTNSSAFEICNKKEHSDSIKECKTYLKKHYPIGKLAKFYYNPDDISDVAIEKIGFVVDIVCTVFGSIVLILSFTMLISTIKI